MNHNFLSYDEESFPNFYSLVAIDHTTETLISIEVSWRKNELYKLRELAERWIRYDYYMVGFNNIGYDYPLLHAILEDTFIRTASDIYRINDRIIKTPFNERMKNVIPPYKVMVKQIDLFKIHHFDNVNKSTSLKKIEFVMRAKSIEESKYPFGVPLPETDQAADETLNYNKSDTLNTKKFFEYSYKQIEFRFMMTEKYNKNFINHNDTKIGKDYFIMALEKAGVNCYDHNRQPRQTHRNGIKLSECIFPYVQFMRPEFQAVYDKIAKTVVHVTKGSLKLSAVLDGFSFDFGLGGIHGSVKGAKFESDDDFIIIDADVTSFYPKLAIVNRVYPEHLTDVFCDVYEDVFQQRASHPKGTVENAAMKLALNGVYGDSNNQYSVFYDSKYTMTVTVNGQLLLCMLAEQLMAIPGLTMIQINTDGMTVKLPRQYQKHYDEVCEWWQKLTLLNLEFIEYKKMIVRDVNSYIAIPFKGKVKFKGAYVHTGAHEAGELDWNKNHSSLIVKKAAVKAILEGVPVDRFIRNHDNIYDFFKVISVGKRDGVQTRYNVMWEGKVIATDKINEHHNRVTRYLVSDIGLKLTKTMPPLRRRTNNVDMIFPLWRSKKDTGCNKNLKVTSLIEYEIARQKGYKTKDGGTYEIGKLRMFEVAKDMLCTVHDKVGSDKASDYDINYDYYIGEAEKLVHAMSTEEE